MGSFELVWAKTYGSTGMEMLVHQAAMVAPARPRERSATASDDDVGGTYQ